MAFKESTLSNVQQMPNLLGMDFVNTLNSRGSDKPRDRLSQFSDLILWAQQIGLINEERANALGTIGQQEPENSKRVFYRAINLRESIYGLIKAVKENTLPQSEDLEILNQELGNAASHLKLAFNQDHYEWEWEHPIEDLDQILWPIAYSAGDILNSATLQRVGICEDETCGWLFYDTSKNHSRRWCDMDDCGNRAKARRHYARNKIGSNPVKA